MKRYFCFLLLLIGLTSFIESCTIYDENKNAENLLECILSSYIEVLELKENQKIAIHQTRNWSGRFSHISISSYITNFENYPEVFIADYQEFKISYFSGEIRDKKFIPDEKMGNFVIPNSFDWQKLRESHLLRSANSLSNTISEDFNFLYSQDRKCIKFMRYTGFDSVVERIKEKCPICE